MKDILFIRSVKNIVENNDKVKEDGDYGVRKTRETARSQKVFHPVKKIFIFGKCEIDWLKLMSEKRGGSRVRNDERNTRRTGKEEKKKQNGMRLILSFSSENHHFNIKINQTHYNSMTIESIGSNRSNLFQSVHHRDLSRVSFDSVSVQSRPVKRSPA